MHGTLPSSGIFTADRIIVLRANVLIRITTRCKIFRRARRITVPEEQYAGQYAAKSERKKVLQKAHYEGMELAYAVRLGAIKSGSRAAIISHLHERGFLMNNSIDLLFR